MLKTIEQHWPKISIILILVILASLFFWPGITRSLGMIGMFFALMMTTAFLVRGRVQAYRKDQSDSAALMRNIAIDLLGMLVALAVVSLAAGAVIQVVGGMAGTAAEQAWPGWGVAAAILAGLMAGIIVGAAVGFVVKLAWGKLTKPNHR
jgi:cytochrome bd-type quinol oxidase subunit 2